MMDSHYADGTLLLDVTIIRCLPKERLEEKMKEAYADYMWLQNEGRHRNDPTFNVLAVKVMDIMEEIQRTISKKSGYRT